jgi:hypothetical protein
VPAPIDAVVPPIGGNGPDRRDVRPLQVTAEGSGGPPTDNDDAERRKEEEQKRQLDEAQKRLREQIEKEREKYKAMADRGEIPPQMYRELDTILSTLSGKRGGIAPIADPAEAAAFLITLDVAVSMGKNNPARATEMLEQAGNLLGRIQTAKRNPPPQGRYTAAHNQLLQANKEGAFALLNGIITMGSPDFQRIEAQFNQAALGFVGLLGVPLTAADLAVTAGVTLGGRAAVALARLLPGRTAGVASRAVNAVDAANCPNSFSPETKVATAAGMVAIAAVVAGTPVLAYNEQTGKNEYRPVLEQITPGVIEKRVTYLTLKDDETGLTETLTTTFGHPFYLAKNVDGSPRPAPEGHEDLRAPWVGAGDLKAGDRVRQADGTTGTVTSVRTVTETRQMYNLTVDTAHTFYVGEGRWLVHNTDCWVRDLFDDRAIKHILEGDATGGGHRFGTGIPGKSEFPSTWDDDKILREIADVLTDPVLNWSNPDRRGYITVSGVRDGVEIKVVYDTINRRIVTGYPTNTPRNPR